MSILEVNVTDLERLSESLSRVDGQSLRKASVRALNVVVNRGFDQARRVMLSGVNLNDAYVKERMTVEEAVETDETPTARIIAFRPGGQRRPATKPVNLRQFAPQVQTTFTNWRNTGMARNSGKKVFQPAGDGGKTVFYENPRKPGAKLPFKKRTGTPILGIPVGQKVEAISVEVVSGRRKFIRANSAGFKAFMQRMPNGEVLVMRRVDKNGGGKKKGKIEALYSLSVAQLFNFVAKKDGPVSTKLKTSILEDLETTVSDEVIETIKQAVNL